MINNVFYLVIVIFAFSIGIVETLSVINYQNKDCKLATKAIKNLQKCYKEKNIDIKVEKKDAAIIRWFSQHLKGEIKTSAFTPERNNNGDFIFLSYPSFLGKPVPRSPVSFAPALLTAIGILGTFTGIFLGLQGVDLGNISETQQLIEASQKLLMGMKTSFSTSLFGLGAAIFFIIFLSLGAQKRTRFRNNLRKDLSNIAILESPNRLLSRLDNEGHLEVAKTLKDVANNLSSLNADVIAHAVKSAIASSNNLVVQELKQIKELQNHQVQNFNTESLAKATSQQFKTTIAPIISQLKPLQQLVNNTANLPQLTPESIAIATEKQLSQPLENINQLVNNTANLSQLTPESIAIATEKQLSPSLENINQLVNNTANLPQLTPETISQATEQQFAPKLQAIFQQIQQLQELQESQEQTIESLVKQLRTELIEPVVTRLEQSAELTQKASVAVTELKNELGGVSQSLAGAVETIQSFQQDTLIKLQQFTIELRNILGEFQTDTKGVLEGVALEINRAVEQSIQGMEQQRTIFKENADEVSETFQNIHGIIRDTNQVVQQELEVFRTEYQNRLQEFLGNQHQELQTIVKQIGRVFQEDVEKREKLIQQIEQSMDKIQQTVKVTSNLANAIGLSDSQRLSEQQAFFREISHSAYQVTKQYDTMIDRFNEAHTISNERLSNYLKEANEIYTNSIKDADKAAAEVCMNLNATAHGLTSAAEFLVAATQEFKNSESDNDLVFAESSESK